MSLPAVSFTPAWLSQADVKAWLRLNAQDTADDALLDAVCAQTEPYVQRCRPEWGVTGPTTVLGILMVDPSLTAPPGVLTIRMDEWEETHPDEDVQDGSGYPFTVAPKLGLPDTAPEESPTYVRGQGVGGGAGVFRGLVYPDLTPVAAWELREAYAGQVLTLRTASSTQVVLDRVQGPTSLRYFPDPETYQGAVMYAARQYRRRNSPAGIETFGETTSFVSRWDPDIDRALQTGSYARPVTA